MKMIPRIMFLIILLNGILLNVACNKKGSDSDSSSISIDDLIKSSPFMSGFVKDDKLYVAAEFSGLKIFDVEDKKNPELISTISTVEDKNTEYKYYSFTSFVYVKDDYAYVINQSYSSYNSFMTIIDVSDAEKPKILSKLDFSFASRILVSGKYGYVDTMGGISIVDLSDAKKPVVIKSISMDSNTFGYSIKDYFIKGSYLYMLYGEDTSELKIVNISDPGKPLIESVTKFDGEFYSLANKDNYIYIVSNDNLTIFNVSDVKNPKLETKISDTSILNHIKIEGNCALLFGNMNGKGVLNIFDLSDSLKPSKKTSTEFCVNSSMYVFDYNKVLINGGYIYIPVLERGMHIYKFDSANSSKNPDYVSRITASSIASDISVEKGTAYIADSAAGLKIIDVSDPDDVSLIRSVDIDGYSYRIVVKEKKAFLAFLTSEERGGYGLCILNVSDPKNAEILSTITFNKESNLGPLDLDVEGNTAVIICDDHPVHVLDVTDAKKPVEIKSIDPGLTNGSIGSVCINRNKIYFSYYEYDSDVIGIKMIDHQSNGSTISKNFIVDEGDYIFPIEKIISDGKYLYAKSALAVYMIDMVSWKIIDSYGSMLTKGMFVDGDDLYVGGVTYGQNGGIGVNLIDISNPSNIKDKKFYLTEMNVNGIYADDKAIYLAKHIDGIGVIKK